MPDSQPASWTVGQRAGGPVGLPAGDGTRFPEGVQKVPRRDARRTFLNENPFEDVLEMIMAEASDIVQAVHL